MTSAQGWFTDNVMSLVVRTRGDAAALASGYQEGDLGGGQRSADYASGDAWTVCWLHRRLSGVSR